MFETERAASTNHDDRWSRDVESLFVGRLAPRRRDALHAHIRACSRCERLYDRFAQMERVLAPPRDGRLVGLLQEARIAERLFAARAVDGTRRARFLQTALLVTGGMVAAGIAAVTLRIPDPARGPAPELRAVVRGGPSGQDGARDFTERGSGAAARPASAAVSLRALAVRPGLNGQIEVTDLASEGAAVAPGERVKLLYTNLGGYRAVAVDLVTRDGWTVRLVEARAIERSVEDAPLGDTVQIPEHIAEGPLDLVATFSGEPNPSEPTAVRRVRTTLRAPATAPVTSPAPGAGGHRAADAPGSEGRR